jgi:hypothetical protein
MASKSVMRARAAMALRTNLSLLVAEGVQGALKAKSKLNDTWTRRQMSPKDFHKPTKVGVCLKVI